MHNKKPVVSHNDTLNVVFNPYRYKVNTLQHYFTKKDKDGNYTIKKDKEDYSLRLQLIIKPSKKIYKVYLFLKQTSNLIYSKPKSQIFEFGSTLQLIQNEAVKHDETKTGTVERTMYGDNLGNFIESKVSFPQDMIEKRETLVSVMSAIQNNWEMFDTETRSLLSDAITADILGTMFDTGSLDSVSDEISSEYENIDVFENFRFINQEMLRKYFQDPTYKLPTQTEIGLAHGGMSKSGVSKKLKRFYAELIIDC
jgi:hypothetical protein